MPHTIITSSALQTQSIAAQLAPLLQKGDCITLQGDLGAGKTCFAKGLISAWAGMDASSITSPTFTLVQPYAKEKLTLWHYDLYRIEAAEELQELGMEDTLEQGINLIEWPEIAAEYLSATESLHISLRILEDESRQIRLEGNKRLIDAITKHTAHE